MVAPEIIYGWVNMTLEQGSIMGIYNAP